MVLFLRTLAFALLLLYMLAIALPKKGCAEEIVFEGDWIEIERGAGCQDFDAMKMITSLAIAGEKEKEASRALFLSMIAVSYPYRPSICNVYTGKFRIVSLRHVYVFRNGVQPSQAEAHLNIIEALGSDRQKYFMLLANKEVRRKVRSGGRMTG